MPIVSRRRDDDSSAADLETTRTDPAADDRSTSSRGWLGKTLLGLGLLAVVAVAIRRLGGLPTSVGDLPEAAPDSTGERDAVSVDVQSPDGTRTSTGGGESDPPAESVDDGTSEPDTETIDEAMEERSVEDIQEAPAEPGEMTVDDDVVDGVTDEGDSDATGGASEDSDATGGASENEADDDRE